MFHVKQQVKILPHSDFWMMGERWGTIVSVGRKWITVAGNRSNRKYRFSVNTDALEPYA
jgi:hypothetical protein